MIRVYKLLCLGSWPASPRSRPRSFAESRDYCLVPVRSRDGLHTYASGVRVCECWIVGSYLSSCDRCLVVHAVVAVVDVFLFKGVASHIVPLAHAHIDGIYRGHWNNDFPKRCWLGVFDRRLDPIHIALRVLGDFIPNQQTVQGAAIEQ